MNFNWGQQYSQQQFPLPQPPQVNRAPSFGVSNDEARKRTWSDESTVSTTSTQDDASTTSNKRSKRSRSDDDGPSCSFRRRCS